LSRRRRSRKPRATFRGFGSPRFGATGSDDTNALETQAYQAIWSAASTNHLAAKNDIS
jgi:hypothetical protein